MGLKPRKRYFIVWLSNTTDHRDDEPIKVKAMDKEEARTIGGQHTRGRFTVDRVYTLGEFRSADPWWASIFTKQKAINE